MGLLIKLLVAVGMAFNQTNFPHVPAFIGMAGYPVSFSNKVCDNSDGDYAHRVDGDAYGIFFSAPFTDTITDVYLYASDLALVGSPSVTGGFYNNNTTGDNPLTLIPGSSTATATNVVRANWMRFTNLNALVTPGQKYWFVAGNANAGTSTTSVTFQISSPINVSPSGQFVDDFQKYTSSDGGITMSSLVTTTKALGVFKFQNNGVYGSPYTNTEAFANSNFDRGNLITGLETDIRVVGAIWSSSTGPVATGFKIYEVNVGPSITTTSTLLSITFDEANNRGVGDLFDFRFDPITLTAGGAYVYAFVFGGVANGGPSKYIIEDAARYEDVADCILGGAGNHYAVVANADATAWTGEETKTARMALIINPNYAATAAEVVTEADELTVDINVNYTYEARTYEICKGDIGLDAGDLYLDDIQNIGTSVEAITLGDIATPGFIYLKNLDKTGIVTIRNGSGGADVVKLASGDVAFFRLAATAPYAIATTNACDVRVCVFEA